ncbi:hypothetical protein HRbin33_01017 [bacterium HR33]|nr:hypothetical protein HRbin33_01017 [bacterium HR33]
MRVVRFGVAVLLCATWPLLAQQRRPESVRRTGTFQLAKITESSGVAVSRTHRGVLWTHNDSGDGPFLYAFDLEGKHRGTFRVSGARAIDWEDLALGRCAEGNRHCLYISDTGDNLERRPSVTIWIVPEPEMLPPAGDTSAKATEPARGITIRYPDRPHDVEAMWVEPDGSLMLVTKGLTGGIRRYTVPRSSVTKDSAVAVLLESDFIVQGNRARWVTGAAISPSGRRIVVRTYDELHFFRRSSRGLEPDGPPCLIDGLEPQGEAVDFWDEDTLVLTSEAAWNQPGSIHLVRC